MGKGHSAVTGTGDCSPPDRLALMRAAQLGLSTARLRSQELGGCSAPSALLGVRPQVSSLMFTLFSARAVFVTLLHDFGQQVNVFSLQGQQKGF